MASLSTKFMENNGNDPKAAFADAWFKARKTRFVSDRYAYLAACQTLIDLYHIKPPADYLEFVGE